MIFSPRKQASQKDIFEILFCFSVGSPKIIHGDSKKKFNGNWQFCFAMNRARPIFGFENRLKQERREDWEGFGRAGVSSAFAAA